MRTSKWAWPQSGEYPRLARSGRILCQPASWIARRGSGRRCGAETGAEAFLLRSCEIPGCRRHEGAVRDNWRTVGLAKGGETGSRRSWGAPPKCPTAEGLPGFGCHETKVGDELEITLAAWVTPSRRLPFRGRWVGVAKNALPFPLSTWRSQNSWPSSVSGDDLPGLGLAQEVTGGTGSRCRPHRPYCSPMPCSPLGHPMPVGESSRSRGSSRHAHTLPPRPPSPPSGPPIGVRHSLRKDVQPDPPVPPSTRIIARSINIVQLQLNEPRAGAFKPIAHSRKRRGATQWRDGTSS